MSHASIVRAGMSDRGHEAGVFRFETLAARSVPHYTPLRTSAFVAFRDPAGNEVGVWESAASERL